MLYFGCIGNFQTGENKVNSIYNREAINRIASEDRLDKMIVLASPGIWFSVIGAFLIVGVLLIWGFYGKLPTSVDTSGIYMNSDGTLEVQAKYDGFILNVAVAEGDTVQEGDLIATLGTEDEIFQLRQMDTRIQYVETMTFESEYDIVTTDTQEMAQIKLKYKDSGQDLDNKKAELELKKEKLDDAAADVKSKENIMLGYKEDYYATLNVSDEQTQVKYNEANSDYDSLFNLYEQAKNTYISSKEHYYSARDNFDEKYKDYDPTQHTEEENDIYYAAMEDVEHARSESADYEEFMKQQEEKLNTANTNLDKARKEYLEYLNAQSGIQASNTVASTEYAEALTNYNTAKQQYKALNDEVDDLQLQVLISEGEKEDSLENSKTQFLNAKSAKLIDLRAQRDSILNSAGKGEIRSSISGKIYDMNLYTGLAVQKGSKVASLLVGNLKDEEVVCYVLLTDVKKLRKGMNVYIYPSTVKKEEYGHMIGTVTEISSHVESEEDMKIQLGSDSLVADFSKKGPVVEVRCSLEKDTSTVSGFKWSSNRGKTVPLESGTVISAKVITENKRPIDLFIPYLREKVNFEIDTEENGG